MIKITKYPTETLLYPIDTTEPSTEQATFINLVSRKPTENTMWKSNLKTLLREIIIYTKSLHACVYAHRYNSLQYGDLCARV